MSISFRSALLILVFVVSFVSVSFAALTSDGKYDIGSPSVTALYVSPSGNDANSGLVRTAPLRTITHAWDIIRSNLSRGWSVELLSGTYNGVPYLEGAAPGAPGPDAQHPIIFRATNGKGTVKINGDFNTHNLNYLYLINLTVNNSNGDIVHFTDGKYLLIRNCMMRGSAAGQETIKINQAQYVYIEDSEIYSANWNNIDFVAVQYGHVKGNKIHDATDWCMYFKGGSSYLVVDNNEVYKCGTGGISAGQGTGFNYMVTPWINYEANDIKITNNVIHDVTGAGLGVNGGFNILMAYNTLYRVGSQSHTLEVAFGMRQCEDAATCTALRGLGGWGNVGLSDQPIPNKNVYIYNNVIFNPSGYRSMWNHFWIPGPRTPASASGIPSPSNADTNLQIKGNLIWNGPTTMTLGIEESSEGCQASNPTCNRAQLLAQNSINRVKPALVNVGKGDYRLTSAVNLTNVTTYAIPDFVWNIGVTPTVPVGTLTNQVPLDRTGKVRALPGIPGAYATTNATNGTAPPPTCNNTCASGFTRGAYPGCACTCSLSCTSPQLLNATSCSCYTPPTPTCATPCGSGYTQGAYPGCACTCTRTCTSPQILNATSCSCYTPATPPTNNTNLTVRVYVAGESIEKRVRYTEASFTASGTLTSSTNDNNQYGWVVAMADRLKLRSPNLSVVWVGSGTWEGADGSTYSGTYPSTTAQKTSSVAGVDSGTWISQKRAELSAKTYCYDLAFITRGGNDGWMGNTERKDFIKQIALLVSNGSNCTANPLVYVTSHVPDGRQTGAAEIASYVTPAQLAVSELNTAYPSLKIRFVDMYTPFKNNQPTTAFPSPAWSSGGTINYAAITRSGDTLHLSKLSSIYIGEVVANAVDLTLLNATNSTMPPPASCTNTCAAGFTRGAYPGCACTCALSCTSPQVLNATSCSCYSPPTPTCPTPCGSGYTQGAYPGCACTCTRTCTSPQVLNATSCSCYTPIVPPTNTTNTTNNTNLTPSTAPILPSISANMKTHLRSVYQTGQTLGNHANYFGKVGDSITDTQSFLSGFGCDDENRVANVGSYSGLLTTIQYFDDTSPGSTSEWCGNVNPFTRTSMAATMGWSADNVLASVSNTACPAPYNNYLRCEMHILKPSFAFVMFGTNDLQRYNDLTRFRNDLTTIATQLESDGVIPVLSTIPPRRDSTTYDSRVAQYNQVIIEVAQNRNVPLWNYWRALNDNVGATYNYGIDSDGVHPNAWQGYKADAFTTTALRYGYNQRNLGAVQIMEKMKRIVIDDGAADP